MVDFVRALRAAGIRISLAESMDAMNSVREIGITDRDFFRVAMKTTLVKEAKDQPTFDEFFPLFFSSNTPPMQDAAEGMSPDDQERLQEALDALTPEAMAQALRDLLERLLNGEAFTQEELKDAGRQIGLQQASDMYQRAWFERRMNRQMGMQQLQSLIEQLLEMLQQAGMDSQSLQELAETMQQNAAGLSEQISQFVGASLAERMAEREPKPKDDLLDVSFSQLSDSDMETMRGEIRRLAARLRSRAALRQKRAKTGKLDPRRMMRANMRYDGVPIEVKYKTKHVKPCLVLICDLSTSMRYCAEFLLTLIYELQDQVTRTNSFIFISDMSDISMTFNEMQPRQAVEAVLTEHRPGYYSTDLGNSLNTFKRDHMTTITGRTTVIVLGDGRNNYNNPRLDVMGEMMRKSRRLIWFNPEHPSQWGQGDSDMHRYAPLSHGVYRVTNLRELAAAVDKILADG